MALEIEFLDGPPPLEVGAAVRIRVVQAGASGRFPVQIADVGFTFEPLPWGRVVPTDDPGVARLEVVQLAPDADVLLAPTYAIHAHLAARAGQTFRTERRIRVTAQAVELELAFAVGEAGRWTPFALGDLSAPIDWSLARVGDPATQRLFLREGRPILRVEPCDALPAQVDITFPNGETASLVVDGPIGLRDPAQVAPDARAEAPAPAAAPVVPAAPPAAPPPAPAHAELTAEVERLRRYVDSFAGAPRGEAGAGARARVRKELDRVRARLGPAAPPELEARFREAAAAAEAGVLAGDRP